MRHRLPTHLPAVVGSLALALSAACVAAPSNPPTYTMVELNHIVPNSSSVPFAISDPTSAGPVVVGQSFSNFSPPTLSWRAVAWRPDVSLTPMDLLTIAQAGNSSVNRAQDVSPNGMFIVGYSNTSPPHGIRWSFNPASGAITGMQTLAALPGDLASEGVGVNSGGRAVGYSLADSSSLRGATWAPGTGMATLLATPAGSGGIRLAREISEAPSEFIVGRCDMSSTPTTRPIIWKKSGGSYGVGQILDLVAPLEVHDAVGITPDGLTAVGLGVAGNSAAGITWNTATNHASAMPAICCSQNVIYDMNNAGVGVGYTGINFEVFRAVLWWEGTPYDLNSLIANNPDVGNTLFLHVATGINSAGQIVGTFGGFSGGEPLTPERIFILTPIQESIPGDLNGDGHVNGADLGVLLGAWGACPSCSQCPADLNGDCVVDGADLGQLLGNWSG